MDDFGLLLFLTRLKIEDRAISELEFYVNRSRADSGFLFQPEGLSRPLDAWFALGWRTVMKKRFQTTQTVRKEP